MKKFLVLAAAALIAGCTQSREVVDIYKGDPGVPGQNGSDGHNGTSGTNGANGTSCEVSNANGGALVTCGNTSQMIYAGQNGAIGIEGYIYPCGINFSNDEIFLRLTDGKILALYDGGANQDRLVLLAPGNYITTDVNNQNNACHFNVSSDARPKVTSASGWPTSTGVVQ